MKTNRRRFLTLSAGAAASCSMPARLFAATGGDGVLELRTARSRHRLFGADGAESELWTYNGTTPGPEIRVVRGERIRARLVNDLDEPTSIHWHGIRIANAMDGVAGLTQQAVPPGGTFDYEFVAPDAGTYWYHAHNRSWNEVGRGLYGPLIVEEPDPVFDRAHDLTLVIDDWRLNPDGSLDVESFGSLMEWAHGGRLGNWLTVNGESEPTFSLVAGEPYRLRLINAANSRILELDPSRFGARILAYDGQPLPVPAALDYSPFLLGPAQRVDLLVVPTADFALEEISGQEPFRFAGFKVNGSGEALSPEMQFHPNDLPEPDLANARTVQLDMRGGAMGGPVEIIYRGKKLGADDFRQTGQVWALNGVANLADEPFFSTVRGQTIIIETINNTAFPHAMHTHGHHFRVIGRSGATIDDGKPWRDTFLIGAGQSTRIAFVADNPGKWLYHCHMLEHAAAGMTTWFEVT